MKKINLAVTGCMGRMGQQIIKSIKSDKNFKLVSITESKKINKKINGIKINLNTEEAFKNSKVKPNEIDCVIVATTTPDETFPSTATKVQNFFELKSTPAFDVQAVCSGFIYSLQIADSFIKCGNANTILVIGAETLSKIGDWDDRRTCVLFGDGAGAVLIEPSENDFGWEDEFLRSDGVGAEWLKIKAGGSLYPITKETFEKKWHFITQEGKTVFKSAVSEMANATEQIIIRNKLDPDDIKYLLPHQANKRIIDATAEKINLDKNKVLMNIEEYGNTTAATIPLLMHDYESNFKKGDKIILAAFGAGLTWGAAYLTWAYN